MLTFGGGSISFGGGFLLSLLLAVDLVVCPSGPQCSLIPVCRKSDVFLLLAVEFLLLAVKSFSSKILVRLETSNCLPHTPKHKERIRHYTTYIIHCTYPSSMLYIIHHTAYIVHRKSYTIRHTSYITHHTSYEVQHASYTIHHAPYIIHLTPYIIHHTSYIIYHISYIIHHTSYVIDHRS